VRLEVGRGLDQVGRADHPPDPPARHRVGLGDAVDHDRVVGELGAQHRQRPGLDAVVHEVLVDLVGEHPQAVLVRPGAEGPDLVRGVDGAGRVGRRDEQQHLGALGARRLQLRRRDLVVLGLVREHLDRHAAGQPDRLRVGGPVRRRHDHLVARVEHRRERRVDGLLAAVGDQHLRRGDLEAAVAAGLVDDRLLELGQSARGGVAVVPRVAAGLDGGGDDVVGGGEVGLARAESDDGPTLRLQRLGLRVDLQCRGLRDRAEALGDAAGAGCGRTGGGSGGHAPIVGWAPHGAANAVSSSGPGRFGRGLGRPRRLHVWWIPTRSVLPWRGCWPGATRQSSREDFCEGH